MNFSAKPNFFKIQQYLLQQLDDAEREAFEMELENNPDLSKEVDWYRALFSTFEEVEDERLKKLLQDEYQKQQAAGKNRFTGFNGWAIAAGFLLLTTILSYIFMVAPKDKPIAVEEEVFFQPYALLSGEISQQLLKVRGGNTQTGGDSATIGPALSNALVKLDSLYGNQHYQETLNILEQLPASAVNLFYQGNCLIALGRYAEAISVLHQAETFDQSSFSNFAQWYLAIAYYKAGDNQNAESYLLKTIDNSGILERDKQKARKLLEQLQTKETLQ